MSTSIASFVLGTLTLLSCSSGAAAATAGEGWIPDFDQAVEIARKEGKDLFVDFTGSDWCVWCKRLDSEVFSHEEFLTAVRKDFVLVALDYPRDEEVKAKVPNPERNDELALKYGIDGFPTILLMTADGEVYAQTGYQEGGPEKYVKDLNELVKTGREALVTTKKLVADFEAAEGDAKLAVWEQVMEQIGKLDASSPFAAQLAGPVRWALESDPQNAKGLKLRAIKALFAAGQADDTDRAAARELDPHNAEGLLELTVEAQFQSVQDDAGARAALDALDALTALGFKDKAVGYRLNFTAAQWCAGPLADPEGLQHYGKAAQEIGTDNEGMAKYLEKLLAG